MSNWNFLLSPKEQTGFDVDVLEDIFTKYGGFRTPIKTRKMPATFLEYCKGYGTYRMFTYTRNRKSFRGTFTKIKRILNHLFYSVDELQGGFLNRFLPQNTVNIGIRKIDNSKLIVDTFPIYVNRPSEDQDLFYNGKYKGHVLKVQVFCDHQANIIFYSGPHLGCTHDVQLFYENHPTISINETILADKAYCGNRARNMGIVAPHKRSCTSLLIDKIPIENAKFIPQLTFAPSTLNISNQVNNQLEIQSQLEQQIVIEEVSSQNIAKPLRSVPKVNYRENRTYNKKNIESNPDIEEQEIIDDDFINMIHSSKADEFLKSSDSANWKEAIDKEIESLESKGTWELVDVNSDLPTIGSTIVLKKKLDSNGNVVRYKARLVAQGFSQVEGLNFSETFAPVINFQIILLCLSIACHNNWLVHHVDFDSAYLNATLKETIYMRPPKQLREHDKFRNKLLKLKKSIFDLKQSGREWNDLLTEKLQELNWVQSKHEPCLFKRYNNQTEILLLYVDDLLIISENEEQMKCIKKEISGIFQIKDLGRVSNFLNVSISINYEEKTINLKQAVLLQEFIKDIKGKSKTKIPITKENLNKVLDKNPQNKNINQSNIGTLLYLARFTRPDIMFAVSFASRYVSFETGNCDSIIEKITRYLFSNQNNELIINCKDINTLHCYSDSDFAGDITDRHSTSGYALFLGKGLVSWRSSKQYMVSTSTMEAEYVALNVALKEAIALSAIYNEIIGKKPELIIYCDNNAAIEIIQNSKYRSKTKHIDIQYHFAKQHYKIGTYKLERVDSSCNPADIMTKPLDPNNFMNNARKLGITNSKF